MINIFHYTDTQYVCLMEIVCGEWREVPHQLSTAELTCGKNVLRGHMGNDVIHLDTVNRAQLAINHDWLRYI